MAKLLAGARENRAFGHVKDECTFGGGHAGQSFSFVTAHSFPDRKKGKGNRTN
jgi:hypothetical protein